MLPSVRSAAPRYRTTPLAVSSAGDEAVDLARQSGLVLDDWQADVLRDALGERPDGRWASMEVGLIVPRQNGKGSILEARELAGLFLFDERLILHSAHEFKTAAEAFRRLLFLVQSNESLEKLVHRVRTSHGEEGIELKTGQRIRFVARSTGSGRGFSGDTVILDEAYNLSPEAMAALFPTLSARPNPQIWYTSSAPLQHQSSDVLRRFCARGREGGDRLTYVEFSAALDCDITDPVAWAEANPALGIRITEEFVAQELGALGDEFPRERLGHFRLEGTERVIPAAAWRSCEDAKSGPSGEVAFALDVSPNREKAAFGVAADSARGGTHVEVVDHRAGTEWCVDRARELVHRWGGKVAVAKGSPAESLVESLEVAGVPVELVGTSEHAQACGAFYDLVVQGAVRHLGQPMLDQAVEGADRKFYGDAWLWSRRGSLADITPLVAVTLAVRLHSERSLPAPFVFVG